MRTIRRYDYLLTELQNFSLSRGYVYINQWRPFDVREFRASWGVKICWTRFFASNSAFMVAFPISKVPVKFLLRNCPRLLLFIAIAGGGIVYASLFLVWQRLPKNVMKHSGAWFTRTSMRV